jgi:hypothetical protein
MLMETSPAVGDATAATDVAGSAQGSCGRSMPKEAAESEDVTCCQITNPETWRDFSLVASSAPCSQVQLMRRLATLPIALS